MYIQNNVLQNSLETKITFILACEVVPNIPRGKGKYSKQYMYYLLIYIILHLSGEQIKRDKQKLIIIFVPRWWNYKDNSLCNSLFCQCFVLFITRWGKNNYLKQYKQKTLFLKNFVCVLSECMSVYYVYSLHTEARRGYHIP